MVMIRTKLRNTVLKENPKNDNETREISAIAKICMTCTAENCKGDCKKFREEERRIKRNEEDKD